MTARVLASSGSGSAIAAPKKASAFVEALNRMHHGRQRRPDARSTVPHPRRAASGPSYSKVARLQPRMWTGSSQGASSQSARHKIVRKRACAKISSSEEAPQERPEVLPAVAAEPAAKKPRRVSPPTFSNGGATTSFLSSELLRRRYGSGRALRSLPPRATVTFADPIVSEVRTRPRTVRADVVDLFYNKADEVRFRADERLRRRRVQALRDDSDEDDCVDGEGDEVVPVARTKKAGDNHQHKLSNCSADEDDPNEVTESDDSSSDED